MPHRKIVLTYLLLFLVIPLLSNQTHTQTEELALHTLPVDLGISSGVSTILQDRIGFVWVGTFSGLYKYDGYNCTAYTHDPEDSNSLVSDKISALCEDDAGTLWVGTWVGLERFDRINGTFRHFTPNPKEIGVHEGNYVYSLYEDRNRVLWVGGLHGLYQFDSRTEKFIGIFHDGAPVDDITHSAVLVIYEDKEGGLWFGTRAGLQKYDPATGQFKHCLKDRDYEVLSIHQDNTGTLWLGTNVGLKVYDPREGTCATYNFYHEGKEQLFGTPNRITCVRAGAEPGLLRLETDQGLFSFDTRSKTFVRWNIDGGSLYTAERSGTLLLATGTGLKKFLRVRSPFREYSLGGSSCIAEVVGRDGILWTFGSGWRKFDTKAEQFVPYSFGGDRLYFVYELRRGGHMAFITKDGSYCIRDSLGRETFHLDRKWENLYRSLYCGCMTSKGYYVGGHQGGVFLFDPMTNDVSERFNLNQVITSIKEDRLGFLWAATIMGRLVRYDQTRGTWAEFIHEKNNPSSWCGKPVNWLHEDRKGNLWIATSYGMDEYDPATGSFSHFTEKDGLLSNNVRGVAEDDHGSIWVSTTKGISKLNPETGVFKNYDASYGFTPAGDFIWGGVAKGENGEMYVGGARGLIRFHPDSLHDNLFVPPIVITSVRIFNRPIPLSSPIHMSYDENVVSFEFVALSYVNPERNQYKYMMEGVDRDWVYSGIRRNVSYANLDPGEYTFRVRGSNNEGVWNDAGTSISIVITPPWWKTSWAYGLYVLAALGMLFALWNLQLRRVKMRHTLQMTQFEATKLHEVDELKSRFFANISHEFRTPLTLILGPVKQLAEDLDDKKAKVTLGVVHTNASRLLNLVNELLDFSRLESGKMKLQAASRNVVALVKVLLQSFCTHAERKRITLTFHSSEEEILVYLDKDKIDKILTNLLSNAFKFTPEGGRIEVCVARDDKEVSVRISDTGIGIPEGKLPLIFDRFYQVNSSHTQEQEGTGIGLSLTRELVELHKGKIDVESEEGRGTTFTVRLRLGKDHLRSEEICDLEKETAEPSNPEAGINLSKLEAANTTEPGKDLSTGKGKTVILIVEDNSDVRSYIRSNLAHDYRILEAKDGQEGWNLSTAQIPDLIVSDVMMPKINGFRLCNNLKSDERTSHIPVILLTAKATSQDKIEGFETGADEYIMKPFEPAELRARIRNLLEQRKRLHEHFRKHGFFDIKEEKITPVDQRFLEKVVAAITEHISDVTFGVEPLAECMAVSRSLLLKKLDALTGEPPIALIRRVRLEKAARLIEGGFGNISEVALEVGFNNPSYFAECFKKQFGDSPKEYQHLHLLP